MASPELDAVDYAILYHLQRDGRNAITDIADELDVADNTVRNRLDDLEEEGVITGYQANVDYDRAGVSHHYFFICSARVSEREELARQVTDIENVTEVITLMTGKNNVFVVGSGDRKDDITQLAYDIDELGLTIEHEHLIRDHVRNPFSGFRLEENL